MPSRGFNDPYDASRVTDKMLGDVYDTVRTISNNIEFIKHLSYHLENVWLVSTKLDEINELAEQLPNFTLWVQRAETAAEKAEDEADRAKDIADDIAEQYGTVLENHSRQRKKLVAILSSDDQPKIKDNRMSDYLTNPWSQRTLLRNMFDEMGEEWGGKVHFMIHTGDIVHRANCSWGDANWLNPTIGTSLVAGSEYPYGYKDFTEDLEERVGIPKERFHSNAGNHDISGRGLREHKTAWTFNTYRKHFGKLHYEVLYGNIGFIFLSTENGGVGGQIPPWAIDMADDLMNDSPDVNWHLCIHQPILGYGPTPGYVVNQAYVAIGGETTITIGPYTQATALALQVRRNGVLLTPATYVNDEDGNPVVGVNNDYQYVFVDPGDGDEGTTIPMTQIVLTVAATAGHSYQATVAQVDQCQDIYTSNRLEALLTKHKDHLFAVLYGHRGSLHSSTQTNIQQDARGIWHINNNKGLPDRAVSGVHPITAPLIYSIMEWDADQNTLLIRRWNSTAGDWLSVTHPNSNHSLTITYPRQINLGINLPEQNGQVNKGIGPDVSRIRIIERDIAEADQIDPSPIDPTKPIITDSIGKMIEYERIYLMDKSLRGVQPGDKIYRTVYGPAGVSIRTGIAYNAWTDRPDREALREGYETVSGSDSKPRLRYFLDFKDFYDVWHRVATMGNDDLTSEFFAIRGGVFGEKFEPGAVGINDVILLCKADFVNVSRKTEAHLRGFLTSRRPNSATTTHTAMIHARIDHVIAVDGTYRTMIEDMSQSRTMFDFVYCTVAGVRWLALRNLSANTSSPPNGAIMHWLGMRDRDEVGAFTVALAADVSDIVAIQDYANNANAKKYFQNSPVLTKASLLKPSDIPGVRVEVAKHNTLVEHTGTLAEVTLATLTVPANAAGSKGRLFLRLLTKQTSNTNDKTLRVKVNGTSIVSTTVGVTNSGGTSRDTVLGFRAQNSQVCYNNAAADDPGESAAAPSYYTFNGANALTVTVTGQLTVDTDSIGLEFLYIDAVYSDT